MTLRNTLITLGLIAGFFVLTFASYANPYYVSAAAKQKALRYDRFCAAHRHERMASELCCRDGQAVLAARLRQ